nr:hypothetical protein Aca09nite_26070 [Actinoplanes campanulatus]
MGAAFGLGRLTPPWSAASGTGPACAGFGPVPPWFGASGIGPVVVAFGPVSPWPAADGVGPVGVAFGPAGDEGCGPVRTGVDPPTGGVGHPAEGGC